MEKSVMRLSLVLVPLLCVNFKAQAAQFDVPLKGSEKLLINIPQGMLQITANPALKAARIQLNGMASSEYGVYNEGGVVTVRSKNSITKDSFLNTKMEPAKYPIEIQAPSLPMELHLMEGQVQVSQWSQEAFVQLQKGKIISRSGNGGLIVHNQSGEISITDHQGRVDVDAYKAQLTVKNLTGDADFENFAGENNIEKARGFISVSQDQGSTKLSGSSGTLKFEIGKATLSSQNFAGRVEGQTQEGPINIVMSPESDVNVKSQSGRVTVHSANGSAPSLNLATTDGDILGPQYLKVNRESGLKTLRGRMNGEAQKGSVFIRSQDGAIVIR